MPVSLNRKVQFTNPDLGGGTKEYLYGPIGSKIRVNIHAKVSWGAYDVNIQFIAASNTIVRLDGGSFIENGFEDNDSFVISGTSSNNITYAAGDLVVTADTLYLPSGGIVNETVLEATIEGTTPIIAIDFYPNLIENNSGFNLFNLTDRETVPRYSADTISNFAGTPTLMQITTNSRGWVSPAESVIGATTSATIYKDTASSTATEQIFIINHTFTITPLFLANQLELLKRGNPPAAGALKDRFALKYVYTIDAKFDAFNADIPHTSDTFIEFPKGQTGWYNEFVNGRPSVYTKSFIKYTDASNNAELEAVDYCKSNFVQVGIRSPYLFNADSVFIVHVMYLPLDETEYINTTTDYKTNFIYERAVVRNNGIVVQGENTGDYHFLKDVSSSASDPANELINFTIDFGTTLTELFDTKDENNLNYLIFITTGSGSPVSIIADVNVYECDKDDATLFQVIDEWQFIPYPHYCSGIGYSDFNLLPRDTIVAKGQFYIKAGSSDFPVILKNISASIIVTDSVNEFPLETFSIDTSSFLPNCDNLQQIYFEQDRDFIVSDESCANKIQIFRMPTLDISGYNAYEFIYPFKSRWEEWRELEGANQCFDDPTQNWTVYANTANWSVKFSVEANVENRGHITPFEYVTWGEIQDPCTLSYSVEFETFDDTGLTSFVDTIAKDEDTLVKAYAYGDFTNYTAADLYGILSLDAWGIGGIAYTLEIGTHEDVDANYVWYGAGGTYRATITKISNSKIELSAYINYQYLPNDTNQFILAANIREYAIELSSSCTNLENIIITFTCGEFEIVDVGDADTIIVNGIVDANGIRDVWVENLVLVRINDTTWNVTNGLVDGKEIIGGTVTGVMQISPTYPYNNSLVGQTMQGEMSGTLTTVDVVCNDSGVSGDVRTFNDNTPHFFNDNTQMSFNA